MSPIDDVIKPSLNPGVVDQNQEGNSLVDRIEELAAVASVDGLCSSVIFARSSVCVAASSAIVAGSSVIFAGTSVIVVGTLRDVVSVLVFVPLFDGRALLVITEMGVMM